MRLIVVRGGATTEVVVERGEGTTYQVSVDGRSYRVDAVDVGDGVSSLRIDGRQCEIAVQPLSPTAGGGDRYGLAAGGSTAPLEVEVLDPLTHLAHQAHVGAAGTARRQVTAYMPGRVVAILAAEGSEVEVGAGVVVLEAMKMENEIQAEGAGVVRRILVEVGQTVEGGDPLFEIE
jgi:biotin carboxyl carrier protein